MGAFDISIGPAKKRKRTLTPSDKKAIAAKQGWKCKICGEALPARYHIDHIRPFSEGGSDRPSNLQALCGSCHDEKTEHDRHKKRQQKIREKEKKEKNPFGLSLGLAPKRGRKTNDIFGGGSGLILVPAKKGRKKKNVWEL